MIRVIDLIADAEEGQKEDKKPSAHFDFTRVVRSGRAGEQCERAAIMTGGFLEGAAIWITPSGGGQSKNSSGVHRGAPRRSGDRHQKALCNSMGSNPSPPEEDPLDHIFLCPFFIPHFFTADQSINGTHFPENPSHVVPGPFRATGWLLAPIAPASVNDFGRVFCTKKKQSFR
uniref:Uncharacterized protein n=1 Tax=Steinernema glaseri TaxID=37863 RepID=A0A1I7ZYK8_9BILA